MRKNGFILIELLVTLVISSAMAVGLFTLFFQVQRSVQTVDDLSDVYEKASVVYRQFERDLRGVFVPAAARKSSKGEQKKDETTRTSERESQERKPLEYVFYGKNAQKNMAMLTFITCNPLSVYWGERVGMAKPRSARVVYRLIKYQDNPVAYKLVRQEAYKPLTLDAFKKDAQKPIRQMEVIDGIQSCILSYSVAVEDTKKRQKTEKETKKFYSYKNMSSWSLDEKEREQQGIDQVYPDLVELTLVLWDNRMAQEEKFTFTFTVGPMMPLVFAREKQQEDEPDADEKAKAPPVTGTVGAKNARRNEIKQAYLDTMERIEKLRKRTASMRNRVRSQRG